MQLASHACLVLLLAWRYLHASASSVCALHEGRVCPGVLLTLSRVASAAGLLMSRSIAAGRRLAGIQHGDSLHVTRLRKHVAPLQHVLSKSEAIHTLRLLVMSHIAVPEGQACKALAG